MGLAQLKYNPGVRGDAELIDGFVVRHHHLKLILEILAENTSASNQHLLIVGPRGSGKTTLVRRVAAEVRQDATLGADWYPIVFAEESYLISSPGEFWLEALFHLGEQTQDERWDRVYQELRKEPEEARLRQRALAQLMDFATESGKRVLLVVENMNMLLGEQMKGAGDWDLRHTLMNEHRVMLLGTATSRFEGIERIDKAWFELFAIHELQPLDAEECSALWQAVTGEEARSRRLRPIQILTGGNPRLLRILAEFAAGKSFSELMSQLVHLIDEHTEYFKSHLDNLAAQERKVFVSLLELWDPASSKDVAQAARLGVSKTSSLLNRLVSRGAVQLVDQQGRRKIYQTAERLFNIYYLMRRRGNSSSRVRAAVTFMTHFYRDDLVAAINKLAKEAGGLLPEERQDHYRAYLELTREATAYVSLQAIVQATPSDFFDDPDAPSDICRLRTNVEAHVRLKDELKAKERQALDLIDELARLQEKLETIKYQLHDKESFDADEATPSSLNALVASLREKLQSAQELTSGQWLNDYETSCHKALEGTPHDPTLWITLGIIHYTRRCYGEAALSFRKATDINPQNPEAWYGVGICLESQGDWLGTLTATQPIITAAAWNKKAARLATELLIPVAAAGYSKKALHMLTRSEGAEALEPLVVGLRIVLGESPVVAREILEVGHDVAQQVRDHQAAGKPPA